MPYQTNSSDPQAEYRDTAQKRVMVNQEESVTRVVLQNRIELKVFD
jgi:hypothetical protein